MTTYPLFAPPTPVWGAFDSPTMGGTDFGAPSDLVSYGDGWWGAGPDPALRKPPQTWRVDFWHDPKPYWKLAVRQTTEAQAKRRASKFRAKGYKVRVFDREQGVETATFGADHFGLFNLGNKKSSKRNQAFEVLKKVSAAIGHERSFSARAFRAMTRPKANTARREVARALKSFAQANEISLTNPGDPFATYNTANANLAKVKDFASLDPTLEEAPLTEPAAEEDPGTYSPPGQTPDLFAPITQPPGTGSGYSTHPMMVPPTGAAASPSDPGGLPPEIPEYDKPFWTSPWVWGGAIAGFGILGLGAYLLMRDKEPAPGTLSPVGSTNVWW